jgi:hypothetical protein
LNIFSLNGKHPLIFSLRQNAMFLGSPKIKPHDSFLSRFQVVGYVVVYTCMYILLRNTHINVYIDSDRCVCMCIHAYALLLCRVVYVPYLQVDSLRFRITTLIIRYCIFVLYISFPTQTHNTHTRNFIMMDRCFSAKYSNLQSFSFCALVLKQQSHGCVCVCVCVCIEISMKCVDELLACCWCKMYAYASICANVCVLCIPVCVPVFTDAHPYIRVKIVFRPISPRHNLSHVCLRTTSNWISYIANIHIYLYHTRYLCVVSS